MTILHIVSFILVIVGGLNWGLTAFGWNVVNMLLGGWPQVEMIVYVLVGLSALYMIFDHMKSCKMCEGKKMGAV